MSRRLTICTVHMFVYRWRDSHFVFFILQIFIFILISKEMMWKGIAHLLHFKMYYCKCMYNCTYTVMNSVHVHTCISICSSTCVYIMFVMMFVYICATTNPKFLLFNVPFSLVDSDDEKIELYAKKTF